MRQSETPNLFPMYGQMRTSAYCFLPGMQHFRPLGRQHALPYRWSFCGNRKASSCAFVKPGSNKRIYHTPLTKASFRPEDRMKGTRGITIPRTRLRKQISRGEMDRAKFQMITAVCEIID